jgi:hypothetical protein
MNRGQVAACALVGVMLLLGGCYERVIQAKGPGASGVQLQKPYQEDYKVDNWLFGSSVKPTPPSVGQPPAFK